MSKVVVNLPPVEPGVFPQSVCEVVGIKPDAKIMVVILGDVIRLLPFKPAAAYRGIARGIDTAVLRGPDRL